MTPAAKRNCGFPIHREARVGSEQRAHLGQARADLAAIADLFPSNEHKPGRPWRDHRQMLNAMFWILHTGAQWRDLPERYGPWQTCYERFRRWQADGTWQRLLAHAQTKSDAARASATRMIERDGAIMISGGSSSAGRSRPADRRR